MKIFIPIFFFLAFSIQLNGQSCLPAGITLQSQTEVDNFSIDYPGCIEIGTVLNINDYPFDPIINLDGLSQLEKIDGNLRIQLNQDLININGLANIDTITGLVTISGNGILNDLSGLSNLSYVGTSIFIGTNSSLTDINGFSSLTDVGSLNITNNDNLTSLTGLTNITNINNGLSISNNPQLPDLLDFSNLTNVNNGGITVDDNDMLVSLQGLNNLDSIDGLFIIENGNLINLGGLDNLVFANDFLYLDGNSALNDISALSNISDLQFIDIINNTSLTYCAINSICDAIDSGATLNISNNDSGCNSVPEVESSCNPLPLEWSSQLVTKINHDRVLLNWSVSNQQNNNYFEVEKSSDGIIFNSIGKLIGDANTAHKMEYSFLDFEPLEGVIYYRIKQVDLSEEFSYSNTATAKWVSGKLDKLMYPNPAKNMIYFNVANSTHLEIFDSVGKTFINKNLEPDLNILNIEELPSGIYFVTMYGYGTAKLIVQ